MRFHRGHIIQAAFTLVGLIFLVRLFFIQVLSDGYQLAAEKNIIQPVIEYSYRGAIHDRHGEFLVYNVPIYDLMVIPKEVRNLDTSAFCQDLGIDLTTFHQALKKAKRYSYVKPSVFLKNLSQATWAKIQDHFSEYPGFFVQARTVREYPLPMLAHTLGYVGEISPQQLAADTAHAYRQGDVIGISGLEKRYEVVLRGQLGIRYEVSDVKGRGKGKFRGGALDRAAVPGQDLRTTLDAGLQRYGEQLMEHKLGSVVAIAPQTGEILALVSSPSYDPNLLTGRELGSNFAALGQDPLAPLFHRPIMAMYPPGSIFKLSQALIALQEKVISTHTTYVCNKKLVNCHSHPSPLSLHKAIKHSCNPYFYHVFKKLINPQVSDNTYEDTRIGLKRWCRYLKSFGFGIPLGVDLPGEKGGCVPDPELYDRRYGKRRWKASTIRSLDIGQGELLLTPLQMANFAATVANQGYYYTPHVIQQIGECPMVLSEEQDKHEVAIDRAYFAFVANAMQEGVEGGTSRRAHVPGIDICAKTGTAENPHGEDHSICIAFAPKEDPQIALAVCVENAGWGSRAGASIAGLLIEQYLRGTVSRPWIEDYVLKGDFFH
ncbi:MAG: penicillin-binding transpeptidase domain-containing protein [Bacteroidota bacterium]